MVWKVMTMLMVMTFSFMAILMTLDKKLFVIVMGNKAFPCSCVRYTASL